MTKSSMDRAYKVAQELIRDRLKEEAPELAAELDAIAEADIVVVEGIHDHIQRVLKLAGTRHAMVRPGQLTSADLRPDQVMFINCGAKFDKRGINVIRDFVEQGGFLFTTDWALRDVLEPAFPGYVEYNDVPTGDEVVRIVIHEQDDPLLATLIGPQDDPQWWLEGSSYPIKVLRPDDVKVIISSSEIEHRYGESPVFVVFEVGEGRVYHMISHFYLQRSETRTERHAMSSDSYLGEKDIAPGQLAKYQAMGSSETSLGELESAFTSQSMMSSVLWSKQEQMRLKRRGGKGDKNADEGEEA